MTNGGGKHESARVAELSDKLGVSLNEGMFVQSHTPFAEIAAKDGLLDECVLVVGGEGDSCRQVALQYAYSPYCILISLIVRNNRYGFRNVVTPGDIVTACPSIWPFSNVFASYYKSSARPPPRPIDVDDITQRLKIGAIFVFHDPRDWALDSQIILDLLLSSQGIIGTYSSMNNNPDLPNRGFQQDGQPRLYFSNPDLWWAAQYHLPRLGQGGFRKALEGVWSAATGGRAEGVKLQKTIIGKPYRATYEFAERKLNLHRKDLLQDESAAPLKTVYFVGDNPESDIRGTNDYLSPWGSKWYSVLVKTGVFRGQQPDRNPTHIANDVREAVNWALGRSGWEGVE